MNQLILSFILSVVPISELRGALPVALIYAQKNNIPLLLPFLTIILLNFLIIFVIFFFLDNLHSALLGWKFYEKMFNRYLLKLQKKVDKFERRFKRLGYIAVYLFVAIPFPLTGVYSGTLISWILGLERKKSIWAMFLGVLTAGIIVSAITLGAITLI